MHFNEVKLKLGLELWHWRTERTKFRNISNILKYEGAELSLILKSPFMAQHKKS